MQFAVVDIETTGGKPPLNKIIEIAVVVFDGKGIVAQWSSLVNPQTAVPPFITRLTGISTEMVREAPLFEEIAKQFVELTQDCIFVAHNVAFDYNFIQSEFHQLGYRYLRKKLCTVRLSRHLMPGRKHYNLDAMIELLSIPIDKKDRHRALGDALATTELLKHLLSLAPPEELERIVQLGIQEAVLPKEISLEKMKSLPEETGIYYLHNNNGDAIYIGKSLNIRKRVLEHFAGREDKSSRLQRSVRDITYEVTGSELIALLLESHQIKELQPVYNRAQKRVKYPYGIYPYANEQGTLNLMATKHQYATFGSQTAGSYETGSEATQVLKRMMKSYQLCAKHCGIEEGAGSCIGYIIRQCKGICIGEEDSSSYNERVNKAIAHLQVDFEQNMILIERGRTADEVGFVLIENQVFRGYGYMGTADMAMAEDFRSSIKPMPHTTDAAKIIKQYMRKSKGLKIVRF